MRYTWLSLTSQPDHFAVQKQESPRGRTSGFITRTHGVRLTQKREKCFSMVNPSELNQLSVKAYRQLNI